MKAIVYGSWHLAEVYSVGLCRLGHSIVLVPGKAAYEKYYCNLIPPVFEPGITEDIKQYTKKNMLSFAETIQDVSGKNNICFFAEDCTVTPDGVDMKEIEQKFSEIAKSRKCKIIVVSSQIPVGTCRRWQKKFRTVKIAYMPEFLRFGDALKRFLEPDNIVLGGDTATVKKILPFFEKIKCPKFSVSLEEAEMAKHAANIFVATTVSFVSEFTKFSRRFSIDMTRVGEILRTDKRIGAKAYTMPGLGFSGTVVRDFHVLFNEGKKAGISLPMLEKVVEVNDEHNRFIERELKKRFKTLKGRKIGFLGATYKPFTSNMRGSLVAPLAERIKKAGGSVALYDPFIEKNTFTVNSLDEAFRKADAVIIAVEKKEFKRASYRRLAASMRKKIIIDAANMLPKDFGKIQNIDYSSIGRGI